MRFSFEKPQAVATSLIDPFDPGGRGAVSPRRSLFRHLNRPQAKTSALPLLPPVYPPEELPSGATLKLLYEPLFTLFTTYSNKPFSWLIVWRLMAEVRVIEVSVMATLAQ
jgi:hypothetical protein